MAKPNDRQTLAQILAATQRESLDRQSQAKVETDKTTPNQKQPTKKNKGKQTKPR
jgi:hypothetical protein